MGVMRASSVVVALAAYLALVCVFNGSEAGEVTLLAADETSNAPEVSSLELGVSDARGRASPRPRPSPKRTKPTRKAKPSPARKPKPSPVKKAMQKVVKAKKTQVKVEAKKAKAAVKRATQKAEVKKAKERHDAVTKHAVAA